MVEFSRNRQLESEKDAYKERLDASGAPDPFTTFNKTFTTFNKTFAISNQTLTISNQIFIISNKILIISNQNLYYSKKKSSAALKKKPSSPCGDFIPIWNKYVLPS